MKKGQPCDNKKFALKDLQLCSYYYFSLVSKTWKHLSIFTYLQHGASEAVQVQPLRASTIIHLSLAYSQANSANSYVEEREKRRKEESGTRSAAGRIIGSHAGMQPNPANVSSTLLSIWWVLHE
jgi:hypothetical protein